jgi:hypothetical protein
MIFLPFESDYKPMSSGGGTEWTKTPLPDTNS